VSQLWEAEARPCRRHHLRNRRIYVRRAGAPVCRLRRTIHPWGRKSPN